MKQIQSISVAIIIFVLVRFAMQYVLVSEVFNLLDLCSAFILIVAILVLILCSLFKI